MSSLFDRDLRVLNVGIASFADSIRQSGAHAVQLQWAPPAQGNRAAVAALAALANHPRVEAANARAFRAYSVAMSVLEGIGAARKHIPDRKSVV